MSLFRGLFIRKTIIDITHLTNTAAREKDENIFQTKFKVRIVNSYSSVMLVVSAICLAITLIALICELPVHIPAIFGILGGVGLAFFLFLKLWHYEVDEDGVRDKIGFISFRKIPWQSIKKVTSYKNPQDKTTTLFFYDSNRIRFDCSSLMIGYNNMRKMVQHKGIPIIKVDNQRWLDWIQYKS